VDISSPPEANAANDLLKVMLQTFAIMMQTINRHELKQAHVLVKPDLAGVGSAAFSERQRSMAAGRAAMLAAMPKLKAQMAALAVPIAR
jgi:NTE family protein